MREAILNLLKTLPADRQVEDRGGSAWLRCPLHGGGQESTPSFKVTLEGEYAGCSWCFGCGQGGAWKKTVVLLGFSPAARFMAEEHASAIFSDDEEAQLLGRRPEVRRREFRERWPRQQAWRGVPGQLIGDVGGCMIIGGDGREPLLRLPAMVRGREVGHIDCKIRPGRDDLKKYLNSPGRWTRDALYPYDYVRSLDPDVAALVEGGRDALVTIRNGLPALAALGSTSWSRRCVNLILALGLKTLLLLLDPDDAGDALMRRAHADLSPHLHVVPIRLPSKVIDGRRVKLIDPANLRRRGLERVCQVAGVRLPTLKGEW